MASLNPIMKLMAVFPPIILMMFLRDMWSVAAISLAAGVAIAALTRPRPVKLLRTVLIALLAITWFVLIFALFTRDDGSSQSAVLFHWGPIVLTGHMLQAGAATSLRIAAVFLLAILGSLGIDSRNLSSSLIHQCKVPYRYAYGATSALRFVPIYRSAAEQIRVAHQIRGVQEKPGPVGWVRRTGRQAIPLLAGGVRHAERLALAMDSRGFGAHPSRTDRDPARVRSRDWVFVLAVWFFVAAVIAVGMWAGTLSFFFSVTS